MKSFILIVIAIVTVGCSVVKGPKFKSLEKADRDSAIIFLYRRDLGLYQSFLEPSIEINGSEVAELAEETYKRVVIAPGEYQIGLRPHAIAGNPDIDMNITVKKGERRYIEILDPVMFIGNTMGQGWKDRRKKSSIISEVSLSIKPFDFFEFMDPKPTPTLETVKADQRKATPPLISGGFARPLSIISEVHKSTAIPFLKKMKRSI